MEQPIYDASLTSCAKHDAHIAELKKQAHSLYAVVNDFAAIALRHENEARALEARVAALEAQLVAVPILGALDGSARIPPPLESQP